MIKASVTVSLVPQARGGPFVFWDDLDHACDQAADLGFAAVEIFAPAPNAIQRDLLKAKLRERGLEVAAMGTGAGWLLHRWHLSHEDPAIRELALEFISGMIDLGAEFGCPAIVGSMQGRHENGVSRTQALGWLAEGLAALGQHAERRGMILLYEPLNRYETNLLNRAADTVRFLNEHQFTNVRVLGDLFHMNMEEASIPEALREYGRCLGHVHLVDSNRRSAGMGHIDFAAVARELAQIAYAGFVSAEALPYPDSASAARQTMETFKRYFFATK